MLFSDVKGREKGERDTLIERHRDRETQIETERDRQIKKGLVSRGKLSLHKQSWGGRGKPDGGSEASGKKMLND